MSSPKGRAVVVLVNGALGVLSLTWERSWPWISYDVCCAVSSLIIVT